MAQIIALTSEEIHDHLKNLHEWTIKDHKLHKQFQLENFVQAFGFLTRIALVAERQDHHPEIFNVYNKVEINLTTHDCSGISRKDFQLAQAIDQL
jgi:4a-hydroxytetrahydrobiopterin dehydratase